MLHTGTVKVSIGKASPWPMKLTLNIDTVTLQKELDDDGENDVDSQTRVVQLEKGACSGLGISIKGGREHHLPVLISRLLRGQPAEQSGQLFIGDAILKVDGTSLLKASHDEAVNVLKNTGATVRLVIKHYQVATQFLKRSNLNRRTSDSSITTYLKADDGWRTPTTPDSKSLNGFELDDNLNSPKWKTVVQIPLLMAYITRYVPGTDKLRQNAFEVRSMDGLSSGVIHCDDLLALSQWTKHVTNNILGLTNLQMKLYNRDLPAAEHITFMGWVCEGYLSPSQTGQEWAVRFLALRGSELYIFDKPPRDQQDWLKCPGVHSVYQTMFRVIRESENVDEKQHCFLIQTTAGASQFPNVERLLTPFTRDGATWSTGTSHYLSVETRQELLRIESAWLRCVHQAVARLGSKTFRVKCDGHDSSLTLDWTLGFALYDTETKMFCWKYKFSQLKGSSDDGKSRLRLDFISADGTELHTRELECTALQPLLFCMHAFLTAKVAAVDPSFLRHHT